MPNGRYTERRRSQSASRSLNRSRSRSCCRHSSSSHNGHHHRVRSKKRKESLLSEDHHGSPDGAKAYRGRSVYSNRDSRSRRSSDELRKRSNPCSRSRSISSHFRVRRNLSRPSSKESRSEGRRPVGRKKSYDEYRDTRRGAARRHFSRSRSISSFSPESAGPRRRAHRLSKERSKGSPPRDVSRQRRIVPHHGRHADVKRPWYSPVRAGQNFRAESDYRVHAEGRGYRSYRHRALAPSPRHFVGSQRATSRIVQRSNERTFKPENRNVTSSSRDQSGYSRYRGTAVPTAVNYSTPSSGSAAVRDVNPGASATMLGINRPRAGYFNNKNQPSSSRLPLSTRNQAGTRRRSPSPALWDHDQFLHIDATAPKKKRPVINLYAESFDQLIVPDNA